MKINTWVLCTLLFGFLAIGVSIGVDHNKKENEVVNKALKKEFAIERERLHKDLRRLEHREDSLVAITSVYLHRDTDLALDVKRILAGLKQIPGRYDKVPLDSATLILERRAQRYYLAKDSTSHN